MAFSLPFPNRPAQNENPASSQPIRDNFTAISQALQALDGTALVGGSVGDAALATGVNPRKFRQDSGVGANYVVSGFTMTFSSLTLTISSGVAYVNGYYVSSTGTTLTLAINKDTYVDMDNNGNFYQVAVANNATAGMTLTANSIRLGKAVTNGSAIVQVLQGTFNTSPVAPNTQNWYGSDPLGNIVYNLGPVSSLALNSPYKFSAYRTAALSTTAATLIKIPFDTKVFDTGNNFDVTTNVGRFTAPVSGFYQFQARGASSGSQQRVFVSLFKNGSEYKRGTDIDISTVANRSIGAVVQDLIPLSAGEYVEIYIFSTATVSVDVGSTLNSYFSGFLASRA